MPELLTTFASRFRLRQRKQGMELLSKREIKETKTNQANK